jgi:hypothetical protein
MSFTLDFLALMISEEIDTQEKVAVMIFDAGSLEKLSEMEISRIDEANRDYSDSEATDYAFDIAKDVPQLISWEGGEYVLIQAYESPTDRYFTRFHIYDMTERS